MKKGKRRKRKRWRKKKETFWKKEKEKVAQTTIDPPAIKNRNIFRKYFLFFLPITTTYSSSCDISLSKNVGFYRFAKEICLQCNFRVETISDFPTRIYDS